MKVVLINKTDTLGHHGCTLVNLQIDRLAHDAGIEIIAKLPLKSDWDALAPDDFDAVIVNGEGTLHSSRNGAQRIAEVPAWSERRGVPAHLINSVYQDNSTQISSDIARFATVSARDYKSAAELKCAGIQASIVPDLSLTWETEPSPARGKTIINGSVVKAVRRELYALSTPERPYLPITARPISGKRRRTYEMNRTLAMFRAPGVERTRLRNAIPTFDRFISHLRENASGIITGRFHMVTIALCLEIPVVGIPSNTHKIEALFDELQMPDRVAVLPSDALYRLEPYEEEEIFCIRSYRQDAIRKAKAMFRNIARFRWQEKRLMPLSG